MRTVAVVALVLALFAGTAAAFVVTVTLKVVRPPLSGIRLDERFSPTCACADDTARIRFRVRRADRIDVVVRDESGDRVRTLVEDEYRARGVVTLGWDGRDDAGTVVSDGPYHVSVRFADEDRTIDVPQAIEVDTTAPSVRLAAVRPQVFSPDGDGRRDKLVIDYAASEAAAPLVLVDGAVVYEGPVREEGEQRVVWDGSVEGRSLPARSYDVALAVRDRVGNVGDATRAELVRIRYIDVTRARFVVRRGAVLRFRVDTDAAAFAWRLRTRGMSRRVVLRDERVRRRSLAVALPRRLQRGRYLLRVEANGHFDTAVVRILRRRR